MRKIITFLKNKQTFASLIIVLIFGFSLFLLIDNQEVSNHEVKNGDYFDIPGIQASEDYGKNFKTYKSGWGFSFKYPPQMEVVTNPEMPNWVVVEYPQENEDDMTAIIISVGEDNTDLTPEEWLLGPNSGYDKSEPYHKTTIDGQDAVYTNGGMWIVVNTPDNKYRLSIADLENGNGDIPFTEMGIIFESLKFE